MVNLQLRASCHQFDGEDQVESEQLLSRKQRLLKRFSAGDLKRENKNRNGALAQYPIVGANGISKPVGSYD